MFYNPLMLIGLTATAVPIIIHLLNRRRYEVVDWGAMRFLQMSQVTRRRLFLEELLLLLLRILIIILLAVGLAGPRWSADLLGWMQPHRSRSVVLVFDGSASMNYNGDGKTPHDAAKEWAGDFLKGLASGDRVAVLQARQQVLPVVAEPSPDLKRQVPDAIRDLPAPGGGCDLPHAVAEAEKILAASPSGDRTIVVLTDGQAFGWSDDVSQRHWKNLADQLRHEKPGKGEAPALYVVNVAPKRDPDPPNWSIDPLRVDFPVIPENSEVTFKTALRMHGSAKYTPPKDGLELDVDGKFVSKVPAPPADRDAREIPVTFTHRFAKRGTHLITLTVTPEEKQDALPDDNHADYVVEVTPPMPVLFVDGNPDPDQVRTEGGRQTLLGALDLRKDASPALKVTARSVTEFDPALLKASDDRPAPMVLVLCNVPSLKDEQQAAVKAFLQGGGGVLVTLGDRADKDRYNQDLYVGGLGWLPAGLAEVEGNEAEKDDAAKAKIAVAELGHPIMDRYRTQTGGGLAEATFPKWWRLDLSGQNARGVVAANMKTATKTVPFLVERQFGAGRVMLCSVPLDDAWGEDLPQRADFVPLVHDLVYYLAGARGTAFNLQPGQPISYPLASGVAATGFRLQPPAGPEKRLSVGSPSQDTIAAQETPDPRHTLVCTETREAGVYRLLTPDGDTVYYVVQGAPGESELKAGGPADLVKAAAWATPDPGVHAVAMADGKSAYYNRTREGEVEVIDQPTDQQLRDAKPSALRYASPGQTLVRERQVLDSPDDAWRLWRVWMLVAVIVLLCAELLLTRHMVKNRS